MLKTPLKYCRSADYGIVLWCERQQALITLLLIRRLSTYGQYSNCPAISHSKRPNTLALARKRFTAVLATEDPIAGFQQPRTVSYSLSRVSTWAE